ncbi:MAG: bifunctional DNA-formamidopyrimidine glycosylase/DNA-(apurinic or apyrimidinic site) lyase [Candidatus Eisenbacteria bacterium]|nr:bifunctional DNA-formamidopyrimidine glycosylase/DNA-(apurinic or apyrimidinic site) lyase [Candidatus Eisenbacteria bacterium]
MPELPEVETVRRMLEATVRGRTIRAVTLSGLRLREPVAPSLPRRLRGRTIAGLGRTGKYLLVDLDGGLTLLSHLGMSGRWLFFPAAPPDALEHVHARLAFTDGAQLWFQDTRRFGLLRLVRTAALARDPALAALGPDAVAEPPTGATLHGLARGATPAVKSFLLDQRRIAGLGNIYASEILHRAGVDPRRRAGSLGADEWERVAGAVRAVLGEAIGLMGTTFSMYRTVWGEPGGFGERLRVYDRAGAPCRACGTPVRRIVQGQRSTFYCPACQPRSRPRGRARSAGTGTS